jgi:hypothetical protein
MSEQLLTRTGEWHGADEEPVQECRGCREETKGRALALLNPAWRVWVPLCFECWAHPVESTGHRRQA